LIDTNGLARGGARGFKPFKDERRHSIVELFFEL
jgi:hypothetical protein